MPPSTHPSTQPYEEPKDLGFGSRGGWREPAAAAPSATAASRAKRTGFPRLTYLNGYHALLTMTWPRFLGVGDRVVCRDQLALRRGLPRLRAAGALAGLDSAQMGGRFLRAFFFSVDTFATIGYGNVYPVGVLPNWLVTVEAIIGLLFVALLTGLVFARFSRPTARLMFSDVAVVAPYLGKTAFMFRVTNARSNQLMELEAKVLFSRLDGSGRRYDRAAPRAPSRRLLSAQLDGRPPDRRGEPAARLHGRGLRAHGRRVLHPDERRRRDLLADRARTLQLQAAGDRVPARASRASTIPSRRDGTVSIDVSRLSDIEMVPDDAELSFTQTFRHTGHFTEGRWTGPG